MLSSPQASNITAFQFTFPCTTCSSVLYFDRWKTQTQTKARRLIRECWKPPPPLVLLCSADALRGEGETARKERSADAFGSSQGQPVLMMAAWRLCCANKKKQKTLLCFLSLTDDEWHLTFFLSLPAFFLWLQFIWDSCARELATELVLSWDRLIKSVGVKLRSAATASIQHSSVGVLLCTQTLLWMMCFPRWCLECYITLYRKNKWENKH